MEIPNMSIEQLVKDQYEKFGANLSPDVLQQIIYFCCLCNAFRDHFFYCCNIGIRHERLALDTSLQRLFNKIAENKIDINRVLSRADVAKLLLPSAKSNK